jgi:uncharacterized tellurite resistance protein B-like protein
MSVIDKVLQGQGAGTPGLTLRESAAAILVAAAASDGSLGAEEESRVNALLSSMRLYRDVPAEHMRHLIDHALRLVEHNGVQELLPACAAVVPDEVRAALFALAVELVFVDGRVAEREKEFIDALQAALEIDEETAVKIVEVALIRSHAG